MSKTLEGQFDFIVGVRKAHLVRRSVRSSLSHRDSKRLRIYQLYHMIRDVPYDMRMQQKLVHVGEQ